MTSDSFFGKLSVCCVRIIIACHKGKTSLVECYERCCFCRLTGANQKELERNVALILIANCVSRCFTDFRINCAQNQNRLIQSRSTQS